MTTGLADSNNSDKKPEHPFRKAVFRGLTVVFPPLLTILIFVWVINTTYLYVLDPVTAGVRKALVWNLADIREESDLPLKNPPRTADGTVFHKLSNESYVPKDIYETVRKRSPRGEPLPQTGNDIYRQYVNLTYLRPYYTLPFILSVFILVLYLLGKFMAAGIGRFFWNRFERGIHRLPLVRSVYSSVKQVSDFLFSEREIEYTRVVAVQYPRKGIWSLGFVTGESMLDIRSAANEPVLSVLMATSPMPATGFTVTVPKSETVDLNITIDQAFQFIISCGVVVPPQQLQQMREPPPAELPQPSDSDQSAEAAASG